MASSAQEEEEAERRGSRTIENGWKGGGEAMGALHATIKKVRRRGTKGENAKGPEGEKRGK